jgi:hypothetical protein
MMSQMTPIKQILDEIMIGRWDCMVGGYPTCSD